MITELQDYSYTDKYKYHFWLEYFVIFYVFSYSEAPGGYKRAPGGSGDHRGSNFQIDKTTPMLDNFRYIDCLFSSDISSVQHHLTSNFKYTLLATHCLHYVLLYHTFLWILTKYPEHYRRVLLLYLYFFSTAMFQTYFVSILCKLFEVVQDYQYSS